MRAVGLALAISVALAVSVALVGCSVVDPETPDDRDATRPAPTSSGSPTDASSPPVTPEALTADDVRQAAPPLLPGGPSLTVMAGTEVAHTADGGVETATWTPAPTSSGSTSSPDVAANATAAVAAPEGGAFEVQTDGTVLVRGADGGPVAALRVTGGRLALRAADLVTVAADGDGEVALVVGTHALASADWGEREGGRSLAVVPTPWARTAGDAGLALLWHQIVTSHPDADTATMFDQLVCHALGAPGKDAWNLEPWRPDVGLVAVLLARCNPT